MEYKFTEDRENILNKLIKIRDCIDNVRKDGELIYGFKYKMLTKEYNISPEEVAAFDEYKKKQAEAKIIEDKSKWIIIRGITFKNPKVDIKEWVMKNGVWKMFLLLINKYKPNV